MKCNTLKTILPFLAGIGLNLSILHGAPSINQFTNSDEADEIVIAAADNNNAVAVFEDDEEIYASYLTGGGPWQPNVLISDTTHFHGTVSAAMDANGTALAIWVGENLSTRLLESSYFSGGVWTTPSPDPVDTAANAIDATSVAMNGPGNGFAAWSSQTDIRSAFFTSGTWTAPTTIGVASDTNSLKASYSPNANASVVWYFDNAGAIEIYANTFNGTIWQGPLIIDANATSNPDAGIDNLGNTIAIWRSGPGVDDVVVRRFDGSIWAAPVTLSTAPGNIADPKIAVAFDGTAVAVWSDASDNVQMNLFNGTTWSAPILVAASSRNPQVTMDSNGNALIGWVTLANEIYYANLPAGNVAVENITFIRQVNPSLFVTSFNLALSSASNIGFAAWDQRDEGEENVFATYTQPILPTAPTSISGATCNNRFASQSDRINEISFTPSLDPTVAFYEIRRNGELIASSLSTGPYLYVDHNRCKGVPYTYTVTPVTAAGLAGVPASITIVP